jgi:hypothetical protein
MLVVDATSSVNSFVLVLLSAMKDRQASSRLVLSCRASARLVSCRAFDWYRRSDADENGRDVPTDGRRDAH